MSPRSNRHEVSIDVRVSGRQFRSVKICPENEMPEGFDVLINDSQCRLLTLHEQLRSRTPLRLYLEVGNSSRFKECTPTERPVPTSS
jgi:hypothetical protein